MGELLDPYDRAQQADPYPLYRELRARDPLHRNEQRNFWALSRFADVAAAFLDPGTYSSARGSFLDDDPARVGRTLGTTDPPRHERLRKLASAAFTNRRVAALAPQIERIARELLAPALERGHLDVPAQFAIPLTSAVIAGILGVPARDVPRVQEWAERSVWIGAGETYGSEAQRAALAALLEYLSAALTERRKGPEAPDDLLSALVAAEVEGDRLSDEEQLWLAQAFFVAGYETTAHAIGNGVALLAAHPDARARLRAEPGLLGDAFEEIVRWDSPAQGFQRSLARPVELYGRRLAPGETILLLPGSANRDEREFPDPDAFRIERRPRRQLGFGQGIHYCIGAPLARLEGRIALAVLLEGLGDWEIEPGAQRAYTARFMLRGWAQLPIRFPVRAAARST
jgi:cytochrome P450